MNRETVENNIYYKSTLVKCNGTYTDNKNFIISNTLSVSVVPSDIWQLLHIDALKLEYRQNGDYFLHEIALSEQAQYLIDTMIPSMAKSAGITEQHKVIDQM